MGTVEYVKMEQGPGIPRLPEPPAAVVYAPLGETPVEPDVVILAGRAARPMLLGGAALRAGVMANGPLLPRPTCMALPAALAQGVVTSSGCIGNRVYTHLGEDELCAVVPGRDLPCVVDELQTIAAANSQLAEYHRGRRQTLERCPSTRHQIVTFLGYHKKVPIDNAELDRLQKAYKAAVDQWVAAIREEEALATPDYSLPAWERWDQAGFKEQDAQDKAVAAKEAYKDGLRQRDYGF